ncbi:MAG: DUF1700 domain-containing protein [Oscillibacter sp.]|nr:DUF1700 domain-containing protein [Oscillibacter sp.]
MFSFGKPPVTRQAWLESLARRLAWAFPEAQAKDIFADYREQFDVGKDRGKSDHEIIEALGAPSEAVKQLMEEDPSARTELLRHCLLWGAALVLCWAFAWVTFGGAYITTILWVGIWVFLPVSSAALFMLLRGPARVALEQAAAFAKSVSPAAVYCIPAGAVLAAVAIQEILLLSFLRLKVMLPENIGPIIVTSLQLFALAMALLAMWLLFRSATRSILYFPGIVHAGGAALASLAMTGYYTAVDLDPYSGLPAEIAVLIRATPYLVGLATACVFQHWVDGSKPIPYCFQAKNANWTDWQHRLAVTLLGWFSAEQTIEILEDYQEQFELSREQGKAETDIFAEMGCPATVVRDLLEEDRKARLRRKNPWPWGILCAFAGWLLLGLVQSFEWGGAGLGHYFDEHKIQIGVLSVVLGTVSLFALLHVRERAAVERRFPVEKKPTVWVFLLPVILAALTNGLVLYICQLPFGQSFYWPVRFYAVVGIEASVLILFVLIVWTLARCFSGSVRYLPATIHAIGCACYVLCTGIYCMHLDFEGMFGRILYSWFLPALLPYAAGVVLAAGVWLLIRSAGKPRKES